MAFLWLINGAEPWEPTTFIFRGCNPYVRGLKPSCLGAPKEVGWSSKCLPKTKECHLKRDYFNRNYIWTNHWFSEKTSQFSGGSSQSASGQQPPFTSHKRYWKGHEWKGSLGDLYTHHGFSHVSIHWEPPHPQLPPRIPTWPLLQSTALAKSKAQRSKSSWKDPKIPPGEKNSSSWWFRPLWKILVKMVIFPK